MVNKAFITDGRATFVCPQCGNVTSANVSNYVALGRHVSVKCSCKCGHRFTVDLEKRRQYRKTTDLPGLYFCSNPADRMDKGSMRVVDISARGLKMRLSVERNFAVGQLLRVEFHLDDKNRTLIRKDVVVRNVRRDLVGTAFAPHETDDPNLGFYLLP